MTTPYKPELGGTVARYTRADGEREQVHRYLLRDVIGWDRSGRPLVFCGDRLQPATEAQFANYGKFLCLERGTDPQSALYEAVAERIKEEFFFDVQRIFIACVEEAVEKKVNGVEA